MYVNISLIDFFLYFSLHNCNFRTPLRKCAIYMWYRHRLYLIAIDSLRFFQNFPFVFHNFCFRPARAVDDDFDVRTRCDRMPAIAEPRPQPSQAAHSAQQRLRLLLTPAALHTLSRRTPTRLRTTTSTTPTGKIAIFCKLVEKLTLSEHYIKQRGTEGRGAKAVKC